MKFPRMSFSLNFHYGGRIVRDCAFYYKGGHEHAVNDIDPDKWSIVGINVEEDEQGDSINNVEEDEQGDGGINIEEDEQGDCGINVEEYEQDGDGEQSDDSDYEASGITFGDNEKKRALGWDDGFGINDK
ncbi:hypothetical protein KIW84_041991 [Lathyrus oleraceus]|uniref:Uncharacterized protein n=1 Tax=Pisum sativum TaxID=3888 RepID=A0A9D4XBM5_PEA|nr:hypothetical protein KIW84_041991 [Pisum sativum]